MGSNLGPDFLELDPILGCVGDSRRTRPPREVQYLEEVCSPAVSVMERLTESLGVPLSTRSTLSGRCVYWGANWSELHPQGSGRKNENECVREVENGSDCERLLREDVPSRKMLQSKEGCANAGSNGKGNLASVRLNVSKSAVSDLGNENAIDWSVNGCDRADHESVHDRHRR